MRILFVQESDWLARGPHQQHQLADRLSLRGHEIRVIDHAILWRSQNGNGFWSERRVFRNVHKVDGNAKVTVIRPGIIKVPFLSSASLAVSHAKEIARQVREFKPDAIVGFGILNAYLAMRVAHRHGIPFVYYWIDVLHDLIPLKPLQMLAKFLESRTLKQADANLAINGTLKNRMVGMGAPWCRVLRAGIDLERFDPKRVNGGAVRKRYGFKRGDTVLFFMGWLYHFSGLSEVALRLAETGNQKLKLLIVGEGDAYGELKQICENYNFQGRVILAGKRPYDEIPALIASSDICLLPADPNEKIMQDIVPIKMYEYLAMGKPVIATQLPGVMKEFGAMNGVAYVRNPGDAVERAVEWTRNGKVIIREIGARGRRFVEQNSWDKITDEFEEILNEVVKANYLFRLSAACLAL